MGRGIVFDISHLVTRLSQAATTGIDRVDLAYARHLSQGPTHAVAATQYGLIRPHVMSVERMRTLVDFFERFQEDETQTDAPTWFTRPVMLPGAVPDAGNRPSNFTTFASAQRFALQSAYRALHGVGGSVPRDAIYLNVAQHAFEHHRFFRWLTHRADVLPVFLIHDLLPIDYPEFFRLGYERRFQRRIETMIARARAIITTSDDVADRIRREYQDRGATPVSIHVEPLASPLEWVANQAAHDDVLKGSPYFLTIATIEPRKNHALLIEVWRALIQQNASPPRLVLVGQQGWESEQIMRELNHAPGLQRHILHLPKVPSANLRALMHNALAVLMPSFAEGYGIPIVEALSLGTPVVCSDIPVFHSVSQEKALFKSPIDGAGWLEAVNSLMTMGPTRRESLRKAREFRSPTWDQYFNNVQGFLSTL